MIDTTWSNVERLASLNAELEATERRAKKAHLKKRLSEFGIGLLVVAVMVAAWMLIGNRLEKSLGTAAEVADKQLVLDDGNTVLVVPAPGHGEPFIFPSLKKKLR